MRIKSTVICDANLGQVGSLMVLEKDENTASVGCGWGAAFPIPIIPMYALHTGNDVERSNSGDSDYKF